MSACAAVSPTAGPTRGFGAATGWATPCSPSFWSQKPPVCAWVRPRLFCGRKSRCRAARSRRGWSWRGAVCKGGRGRTAHLPARLVRALVGYADLQHANALVALGPGPAAKRWLSGRQTAMTVSAAAEQALQEALGRFAARRPVRTDGALTVAGLAAEAGLSRSTANRATSILTGLRALRSQPDTVPGLVGQAGELRRPGPDQTSATGARPERSRRWRHRSTPWPNMSKPSPSKTNDCTKPSPTKLAWCHRETPSGGPGRIGVERGHDPPTHPAVRTHPDAISSFICDRVAVQGGDCWVCVAPGRCWLARWTRSPGGGVKGGAPASKRGRRTLMPSRTAA
jgi:hypothetical protein